MTNLGLAGASSLQALNQWISVIDTNLSNTKRVGYKETRLSLRTNEVETIGKTFTHFGDAIQVPSASLMLDKTLILDYVQGMLNNTENNTDFAIEGKGYFVVEDDKGLRYATRDGQFHFNNDGILVTAAGLKVLTSGQDYIRVAPSEVFSVNSGGISLNSSKYGDRQLMMINLPNPGKLFYSKYGFTTFELGNFVPLQVNNSFDKVIDGINPYLSSPEHKLTADALAGAISVTLDSVTGLDAGSTITINGQSLTVTGVAGNVVTFNPPTGLATAVSTGTSVKVNYQNLYTHNKSSVTTLTASEISGSTSATLASVAGIYVGDTITINGQSLNVTAVAGNVVTFDTGLVSAAAAGSSAGISGNMTVDISASSQALLTAHKFTDFSNSFRFASTGANADTIASYGFNFGQKTATDTVSVSGYFAGIENGSLVIRNSAGILASSAPLPSLPAGTQYEMSLSMSRGSTILTLSNPLTGAPIANVKVEGIADYQETYQSLGTNDITGPTVGAGIVLTSIHAEERDKIPYYDTVMLGGNADKLDSLVRQQFVEESTTTVADAMPLLSNTQKVFAALAKIVSVSNMVTDDLNGLIR